MILALVMMAMVNIGVTPAPQNEQPPPCTQSGAVRTPLLREAIANRYTLRRIEFTGNETIRDYLLRRRVFLREGDFFNQRNLAKSLGALNKLKSLYPLTMNDVIVHLDKPEKLMDVTFCFRERHSRRTGAS